MEAENKDIELRSEKVRNIIGEIPSNFTNYGIILISLIIVSLFLIAYFMPYKQYKDINVSLCCTSQHIYGISKIENHFEINIGQKVKIKSKNNSMVITGEIDKISINEENKNLSYIIYYSINSSDINNISNSLYDYDDWIAHIQISNKSLVKQLLNL